MRRFAVLGNPVAHSRSPFIHQAFAAQHGVEIDYQRIEVALDNFPGTVRHFFNDDSATGLNVTVPFKGQAFEMARYPSERATRAGAANTLWMAHGHLHADNTDGIGLVRDLRRNLGWKLAGKRLLILGAGGAVRGVLDPLLDEAPADITIANRTVDKAEQLAEQFGDRGIPVYGSGLDNLRGPFDVIINAISAGLAGDMPALPDGLVGDHTVCYDMVYGNPAEKSGTPFLAWAEMQGATDWSDGVGMLVEQAAESFYLWMKWRPDSQAVIRTMRHPETGA